MKVFLSLPMRGRTAEEICKEVKLMTIHLKLMFGQGVECVHNFVGNKSEFSPLYLLGRAMQRMADCDLICFSPKYKESRGCLIEMDAAKRYDKKYIVFASYNITEYSPDIEKLIKDRCPWERVPVHESVNITNGLGKELP